MSWVTIIRGKDISKHAEGGAGSGILLTSATPLHASLVCGTSTMARTAGERHFRITSLLNVSRSGYYDWKSREETETERRQKVLTRLIRAIFERSRGTYGYGRVAAELARMGRPAGEELVRKLMRRAGLKPQQVKAYKRTTIRDPDAEAAPDLVRRDFAATAPGQRLVGDITSPRVGDGFGYLATVIDCNSKKVIGWEYDSHMRASLAVRALKMAARNHRLGVSSQTLA